MSSLRAQVLRKCRDLGIAVQDQKALLKLLQLLNIQDDQQTAIKSIFSLIVQGGYQKLSSECVEYIIDKVESNFNQEMNPGESNNQKKQKLEVVDLKSVRRVAFDPVQKRFILDPMFSNEQTQNIFAYPKIETFKNRYLIFQQWIKRSGTFRTSAVSTEQDNASRLCEIKGLIGCYNQHRFTYGMICCPSDGQFELVDPAATLKLDLANIQNTSHGFFTENMMVIIEGSLHFDQKFHVMAMVMPPIEPRESQIHALRGLNTFGGAQPQIVDELDEEEEQAESIVVEQETGYLVILNNVLLNKQENVEQLHTLLQSYENRRNSGGQLHLPNAFVLIGDFLSQTGQQMRRYTDVEKHYELKEVFQTLARAVDQYPNIKQTCQILVIPGYNDYCGLPKLPQLPLSHNLSEAENIVLCANPCRLRLCGREIVVFQQELFYSTLKACIVPPTGGRENLQDLLKDLLSTQMSQCHLYPSPAHKRNIWGYDHLMWLYPSPHAIILAQPLSQQLQTLQNGCSAFTTGNFDKHGQFVECVLEQEGRQNVQLKPIFKLAKDLHSGGVSDDFQMLEI